MERISVIVPVYKVEAYLDRCVRSIVEQTYRDLEIILVDDGSPDNCGAMCDAWAQKDSRIRVIHKENGGLSDARNAGMAAATGAYIAFVDSDDYIAPDMYRLLLEQMYSDGSDMAVCGVELIYEDGSPARLLTRQGCRVLNHDEAMEAIVREDWLKQTVWNRLYKAALVRDIAFPVGKFHEDVFWSWQAVCKAEKVSVLDVPYYFYTQRSGSIMGQRYSLSRLDGLEAKAQRQAFLEEKYPALASLGRQDLLFSCLYHGQQVRKNLDSEEKRGAMWLLRQRAKDCPLPDRDYRKTMRLSHRLWLRLAKNVFFATCAIRNALHIGN